MMGSVVKAGEHSCMTTVLVSLSEERKECSTLWYPADGTGKYPVRQTWLHHCNRSRNTWELGVQWLKMEGGIALV